MSELLSHLNSRYVRQVSLPQIGWQGQQKLLKSKVLCVGAGGLGSSALLYLTAAGMGTIAISDPDSVSLNNLQRQILYHESDVGKIKSSAAVARLQQLNSEITFEDIPEFITSKNVLGILNKYDYILDATDNIKSKLLLNDACHMLHKPLISASVHQFQGQMGVYWHPHGPCWRCVYTDIHEFLSLSSCEQSGVLGMIPGWFGLMQALEIVKICLNLPNTLVGKLMRWDALAGIGRSYQIMKSPDCLLCTGEMSFATLWDLKKTDEDSVVLKDQILVQELAEMLKQNQDIFILDVRNPDEYATFNIGGYLIPLAELPQRMAELPHDLPIIIHCHSGVRSQKALELLQHAGFTDVKNLSGGMVAWQREIGAAPLKNSIKEKR